MSTALAVEDMPDLAARAASVDDLLAREPTAPVDMQLQRLVETRPSVQRLHTL